MGSRIVGLMITSLLSVIAWSYYLAPASMRMGSGRALGALLRWKQLRAGVVEENLLRAIPGENAEAAARRRVVFRQSYEHIGHLVFEILMLFGPMRRFVGRRCRVVGLNHWKAALAQGKGAIFLSSHVGNWEIMAACGDVHVGRGLMIVTKKLKPEWLHRAIERGRARCGVSGTYEPRTMRDVMAQLKKGESIGFILDQYAGPPIGIRVPFFGVPVGTHSIVAVLARRTGAPVVPVVNYRDSKGRFTVEVRPPVQWIQDEDASMEIARNTAAFASILEQDVRAHADQWLWMHKRFKGDLSPLRDGEWSAFRVRK
jgi:KDO2-lipid IV(A) lauroyltransferase